MLKRERNGDVATRRRIGKGGKKKRKEKQGMEEEDERGGDMGITLAFMIMAVINQATGLVTSCDVGLITNGKDRQTKK